MLHKNIAMECLNVYKIIADHTCFSSMGRGAGSGKKGQETLKRKNFERKTCHFLSATYKTTRRIGEKKSLKKRAHYVL